MHVVRDHQLALIFEWEVRTWSRAYPIWSRELSGSHGGADRKALALGERNGGISLMLALHGLNVICSDLNGPSEGAVALHQQEGVAHQVAYQAIDILSIPYPEESFDHVAFKSVIGALGSKARQRQAMAEIHRVLKPGGSLLFAENLTGTAMHRWLRKRFVAWDSYWRYLDPTTDRDLFEGFGQVEIRSSGCLANLGRTEWQRDLLGRIDAVLAPLLPERIRTVWYGVARKGEREK